MTTANPRNPLMPAKLQTPYQVLMALAFIIVTLASVKTGLGPRLSALFTDLIALGLAVELVSYTQGGKRKAIMLVLWALLLNTAKDVVLLYLGQ